MRDPSELKRYRSKRDPAQTTEPFSAERKGSTRATRAGRFVVHLHQARREHYDLRIECSGTLQSFAVPRGPSLKPLDKRLAVHTENHPLEYLDFEAVIPEGNYGAGVGLKKHDRFGHEISVGTEPALRGRGIARLLVATATRQILAGSAIATYLHDETNYASAKVADAAGFPDLGWKILGLWS